MRTVATKSMDADRDRHHVNWVAASDLAVSLTAQSYRPEIVQAAREVQRAGPWKPLREVCRLRQGQGPQYAEGGFPCLKTGDVTPLLVDGTASGFVSAAYAARHPKLRVPAGTVLLTTTGAGSIGRAGVYLREDLPFTNQHIAVITPQPGVDPGFVAGILSSWWGQRALERGISGSTGQLQLNHDGILLVPIPQPAPEIQRAIGNKLRKAERLRDAAHRALSQAEFRLSNLSGNFPRTGQRTSSVRAPDLEFARLDAEFYQPHFLAADAWLKANRTDSLESLMVSGSYGVLPDSGDYGKGTLGFLRATNVEHLYVDETKALRVPTTYAQPKGIAREGDVLLEVKGMISGGAVCPAEADGFLVNGSIFRIRPKPTIDAHYLAAVLVGPMGVVQKQRAASNSVISYVSIDFVRSLRIPRFGDETEREIGDLVRAFVDGRREALRLVEFAKSAVEALIEGTLDEAALLADSDAIERWLAENPSPSKGA